MPTENSSIQPVPPLTKLPIEATIKNAWKNSSGFRGTIWLCMLNIVILMVVYQVIHAFMQGVFSPASMLKIQSPFPQYTVSILILDLIYNFFTFLLSSGILYVSIRHVAQLSAKSRMMWHALQPQIAFKLIAAQLIFWLFTAAGYVIIIAGIYISPIGIGRFLSAGIDAVIMGVLFYFMIRLSLTVPIILDRHLGPWRAMVLSYHSTKGYFWRLLAFILIVVAVLVITTLPAGIGLIWSIPWFYCVSAVIYQKLVGIQTAE